MPAKNLVIFDLDNTLIITTPAAKEAYKQAIRHIADKHGISRQAGKLYNHWKRLVQSLKPSSDPVKRQFRYSLSLLLHRHQIPDNYLNHGLQIHDKVLLKELQLQRGVKELFQWLKDHDFAIAVATESIRSLAKKKLKAVDLYKDIDLLITANDVGSMKPHPDYYRLTIDRSKVKKDRIFVVGDKLIQDIQPAKDLGLKTFQVPPNNFHLGTVQSLLQSAML